jgi:hypothetical protein
MISHGNSELADEMQGFGIYDGRKFRRLNQFLVNHHEKVKELKPVSYDFAAIFY